MVDANQVKSEQERAVKIVDLNEERRKRDGDKPYEPGPWLFSLDVYARPRTAISSAP